MDFIDPPREAVVGMNKNMLELQPKFTFFFERITDKEIVPVDSEDAAWEMYKRNGRDYRFLGRTDGKVMLKAVQEAQQIFKAEGLEKAQERIRQGQQEEFARCEADKTPPLSRDVFGNGAAHLQNNLNKYVR